MGGADNAIKVSQKDEVREITIKYLLLALRCTAERGDADGAVRISKHLLKLSDKLSDKRYMYTSYVQRDRAG